MQSWSVPALGAKVALIYRYIFFTGLSIVNFVQTADLISKSIVLRSLGEVGTVFKFQLRLHLKSPAGGPIPAPQHL